MTSPASRRLRVLHYAGRAVQLAEDLSEESIEDGFLERLASAHSNRNEAGSGREVYQSSVRPAKVTWEMLAAHYGDGVFLRDVPRNDNALLLRRRA